MRKFTTLGLASTASVGEIKLAYRRRAMQLHPDRGGDHSAMVRKVRASSRRSACAMRMATRPGSTA